MALNLPEKLPEAYDEKTALLDGILSRGLEKLLAEVKAKQFMQAPFGRKPEPTPLISEEDFLLNGCLQDTSEADEPRFQFEYGFNPLAFLAEYVRWSHPNSVVERRLERERCFARLQALAAHAQVQLRTADTLKTTAISQGSGVMWGPVVSVLNSTCVAGVLQAVRAGDIFLEVSEDATFSSIFKIVTKTITEEHVADPLSFVVDGLKPNMAYHLRAYAEGVNNTVPVEKEVVEGEEEAVVESKVEDVAAKQAELNTQAPEVEKTQEELLPGFYSQNLVFYTPPLNGDEDIDTLPEHTSGEEKAMSVTDTGLAAVTLACIPATVNPSSLLPVSLAENGGCRVTCLLGDPFHKAKGASEQAEDSFTVDSWGFYCSSALMTEASSLCRNSSVLLGWNDTRFGSDIDVRSEEATFKHYQHDLKKHTKKHGDGSKKGASSSKSSSKAAPPPPVHTRPRISPSLASLSRSFPVQITEDGACRHLYKSTKLGPEVEVFQVDLRSGYLQKAQAKWLKEALHRSTASWKVLLVGAPVAIAADESALQAEAVKQRRNKRSAITLNTKDGACADVLAEDTTGSMPRVQVLAPEHVERSDDLDEHGLPKNRLAYIIASLQRSAERERKADDESVGESQTQNTLDIGNTVSSEVATAERLFADDVLQIDSGIVIISSNSAGAGLPTTPFIATLDPADAGRAFCAEVNVGGCKSESNLCPCVVEHLGSRFSYGKESILNDLGVSPPGTAAVEAEREYVAVLRLEAEGDLSVVISRLGAVDGHGTVTAPELVVTQRFQLASEGGGGSAV